MKLFYATSMPFPSRRANRLQTLAMGRSLAKLMGEDFYFGTHVVKGVDLAGVNHRQFNTSKSYKLAWDCLKFAKEKNITHILCREHKLLFFIMFYNRFWFNLNINFTYEAHFIPEKRDWFYNYVVKKSNKVITLTNRSRKILESLGCGVVRAIPDAVDYQQFAIKIKKEEARKKCGLPINKKIVLYTGQLFTWKGVDALAESSSLLDRDIEIVFVGGADIDFERFESLYGGMEGVRIIGHRPQKEIPIWLQAADILVLPTSAKTQLGAIHTSPLKLFEYMASGVPILATNVPSSLEILNENFALLIDPDQPSLFAEGVQSILKNYDSAKARGCEAKTFVKNYTWNKRALAVYTFIKN